jgi:sensor c-di-GMP phosphodiesterase-like protein
MESLGRRITQTTAVTVLAAVAGLLLGSVAVKALVLRFAEHVLYSDAARAIEEVDRQSFEAVSTLEALGGYSATPCSHEEFTYFRALIYDTQYIRDAGRISDGTVTCSALLANPKEHLQKNQPDFVFSEIRISTHAGRVFFRKIGRSSSPGLALRASGFSRGVSTSITPVKERTACQSEARVELRRKEKRICRVNPLAFPAAI